MILTTTRHLLTLVDRPRKTIGVLVVCSLIAGLAEGAAILVVVRVAVEVAADTVESDFVPFVGAPTSTTTALIIAAGLAAATLLTHLVIAGESAAMSSSVLRNSRARALRAFTSANWATQSGQRVGALQENVAALSTQASRFAQLLATGVSNLIMLVMFLAIAATVNPVGMVIVGLAGLLIFVGLRPITRRTRDTGVAFTRTDIAFAEETANFASSAMELRMLGVSEVARAKLERTSSDVAEKQRAARFVSAFGTTLYRDVAVLMLVGSVFLLTLFDGDAVGSASAVVVLVVRSLASAHAVNALVQATNERGETVRLLFDRVEALEAGTDQFGDVELEEITSIEVRHVTYEYPGTGPALRGVSLSLTGREIVGIVGSSGSGKSTLMQVLLRLRRPAAGSVCVNGRNYDVYSEDSWARRVGFVPQEPSLFEGTIASNIAFHRPCSRQEIEDAAGRANVAHEIGELPDGYDTVLGPRGSGLSGGQKQRIAIARSLIGAPDLLVLDEPSSALDPASEQVLRDTIGDLATSTLVVIVAHRTSTLETCDRILQVEAGIVAGETSPDLARGLVDDAQSARSLPHVDADSVTAPRPR